MSESKRPTPEPTLEELLGRARAGDLSAATQVADRYDDLLWYVTGLEAIWCHYTGPLEDAYDEARRAVVEEAAPRYDPKKLARFWTFAEKVVRNNLKTWFARRRPELSLNEGRYEHMAGESDEEVWFPVTIARGDARRGLALVTSVSASSRKGRTRWLMLVVLNKGSGYSMRVITCALAHPDLDERDLSGEWPAIHEDYGLDEAPLAVYEVPVPWVRCVQLFEPPPPLPLPDGTPDLTGIETWAGNVKRRYFRGLAAVDRRLRGRDL